MAIYHLTAKVVSRGKGQSAVAKAAYNARTRMTDERTGQTHDYTRKGGVVFEGMFAPKDAPAWVQDRATLWAEVEQTEKRKDAQLAREVEVSLPHELTDEQRRQLLTDFVRENFVRKGMVADVVMHAPDAQGDGRNHHAHILLTMREIGPEGFGQKVRDWNSREQLNAWRENWSRLANRYLERHGHEARIDHRSLEAQGLDQEATVHEGPSATQKERRGEATERGDFNREVRARNAKRDQLKAEREAIDREERAHAVKPSLYNRADMVSMQRDAMRDLKQAARERGRAQREKAREERQQTKEVWKGAGEAITQQPEPGQEPQTPEKAPEQDNERQGAQATRDGFWDEFKER